MKALPAGLIVLILGISLLSCDKGHDLVPVTENPLTEYLTASGFTEADTVTNSGDYEFGISFKPKVSGSITHIVVNIPDTRSDLRVTLWDAATKAIIHTETISSVTAHVEVKKEITEIPLTKDHEYMITFNSDSWYDHTREDGSDATYPITSGQISVTGYSYADGSDQVYPDNPQTDYYAGDLSFVFLYSK